MQYLGLYVEQYDKNVKDIKGKIDNVVTAKEFNELDKLLQSTQDLVLLQLISAQYDKDRS